MSKLIFLFLLLVTILHLSNGEIGTAAQYNPPFLPTACYGDDPSQFPSDNQFAAAGDELWNNGAACGQRYQVTCISAVLPGTCLPGQVVEFPIIDHAPTAVSPASKGNTTIVLSDTAFRAIANPTANSINIDYKRV